MPCSDLAKACKRSLALIKVAKSSGLRVREGAALAALGQTPPLEQTAKAGQARVAIDYRPDLDGLRALAVLPVVFFHFELFGFNGGFVGVDIFFVISGYLITSIIVGALESESFSFVWFYERRIRRIIPAFIVMLATVSVASIALFPPKELADFGRSAAAAAAFSSNIFFSLQNGLFFRIGDHEPLLHTWSLGVEEQFYIVWPLLFSPAIAWVPAGGQRACCGSRGRKPGLL